jgi:hypothetical protein
MSRTLGLVIAGAAVVALLVAGLALALGGGKSTAPRIVTSTASNKVERAPATPTRAPARPSPAADESDPTGDDRSDEGGDNEGSDNQAGDSRGGNQP